MPADETAQPHAQAVRLQQHHEHHERDEDQKRIEGECVGAAHLGEHFAQTPTMTR